MKERMFTVNKDPFKEYIKQTEPNKRDKGYMSVMRDKQI